MSDIEKGIDAIIKAKIAEALAGADSGQTMMEKLVDAALTNTIEVRDSSGYGKRRVQFLEHQIDLGIQHAVERAMREVLAEHHDTIKESVRKAATPHIDKMTASIVDAMVGDDWRVNMQVKIPRERSDD